MRRATLSNTRSSKPIPAAPPGSATKGRSDGLLGVWWQPAAATIRPAMNQSRSGTRFSPSRQKARQQSWFDYKVRASGGRGQEQGRDCREYGAVDPVQATLVFFSAAASVRARSSVRP